MIVREGELVRLWRTAHGLWIKRHGDWGVVVKGWHPGNNKCGNKCEVYWHKSREFTKHLPGELERIFDMRGLYQ